MDNSGVRLPDLARAAGVSVATVSRVLGGRGRVAEATAAKVRGAVERLGYTRSTLLGRTPTRLVAIAVPSRPAGWQVEAAGALTNAVAAAGHIPVRGGVGAAACAVWLGFDEPEFSQDFPGPIVRLVAGVGDEPDAGADAPGTAAITAAITVAIGGGIRAALAHLTALGHRRVGLIRPDGAFGDACESAFRRDHPSAAHASPRDLSRWIAVTPDDETAGARAMNRLLDSTCTAVAIGTDKQLLGALDGVRSLKLSAPRDLSLLGIGDDPRMPFTAPAATMVRIDPQMLAGRLCDAALAALEGRRSDRTVGDGESPDDGFPHRVRPEDRVPDAPEVPAELIVRASTGPARGTR